LPFGKCRFNQKWLKEKMRRNSKFLYLFVFIFVLGCQQNKDDGHDDVQVSPPPSTQVHPEDQEAFGDNNGDDGIDANAPQGSAEKVAIPFKDVAKLGVGPTPAWPGSMEQLNQLVHDARYARIYPNPNPGEYLRRAPWLYGDGCYAKAAHISALAEKTGYPRPGKVLAFGGWATMRVYSKYMPGGSYWWNYHVVAAYHIGSQVYVLDPLVNSDRALTVDEWVRSIAPNVAKISVAFCDQNLYLPADRCVGGNNDGAFTGHINEMLNDEYRTLKKLGYDPDTLL
jgi:hypothetical protein